MLIYNTKGEVALFERSQNPVGVWQFPQGGIDLNERPEETLWRELKEEIGLEKSDITTVTELPLWTIHATTGAVVNPSQSRIGQAHRWFFLALDSSVVIDLTKATDDEASAYRWTSFADAINETEELKKHVYQELETYFEKEIRPTL